MEVISFYLIFAAVLSNWGVSIISFLRHKSVQIKQISHKLTEQFGVSLPDFETKLEAKWENACGFIFRFHIIEFYL